MYMVTTCAYLLAFIYPITNKLYVLFLAFCISVDKGVTLTALTRTRAHTSSLPFASYLVPN